MSNYNIIIPHYSVMLAEGLSSIIQDQYQFKNKISMELLSAKMNDVYRVKSGSYLYYLRIPRHERFWPFSLKHYEFEMQLVNYLRQQEISVSYPIPTNSKSFLGILNAPEGIRYFSLHTHADGIQPDMKNAGDLKIMGKYLARFHNLTSDYKSNREPMNWDFHLLIDYGMNKLRRTIPEDLKDDFSFIHKKATELIKEFNSLISKDSENWGIIHGNYIPKNIRIEGETLTLFDFEYCGIGYRIFDLAFIIHKTNITDLKNKAFQTFLSAYQEVRSLSENELKGLQIMAKLALISRMTRTSGMRDLVGVLWFEQQVRHDFAIVKKLL